MNIYTDSKSSYNAIVGIRLTSEKRFVIDPTLLREPFEPREIDELISVSLEDNPADTLTTETASSALMLWMSTNKLKINQNSWIERGWKKREDMEPIVVSDNQEEGRLLNLL